jgi:hypothetical protein
MTLRKITIIGLSLTMLVLGVLLIKWVASHIEFYDEQVHTGLSERALRNPLLAAQRFLRASGVPSESVFGRDPLYRLPSPQDSLLINDFDLKLSPARQQLLHDWLNDGGHLIASLSGSSTLPEDHFLKQHFAVDFINVAKRDDENASPAWLLEFQGRSQPVKVQFKSQRRLQHNADIITPLVVQGDDRGAVLLQFAVGAGRITLLSDMWFLTNNNLAQNNHAFFLWLLTHRSQQVWLMVGNHTPSLWILAWRYNPYLLTALCLSGLLLFSWLWRRFGPLREERRARRRDIMQHLRAVARFHYKADEARHLLESTRASLRQLCLHKHPRLKTLDPAEWPSWLARRTGLDEQALAQALDAAPTQRANLAQLTRTLQQIKQRIRNGTPS